MNEFCAITLTSSIKCKSDSRAIWFPFSWQMNSSKLFVMLTKTTFWSFSSSVRHGSIDWVKFSTHWIALPRWSQYLLKTVSTFPSGFAFSISSWRVEKSTRLVMHVNAFWAACWMSRKMMIKWKLIDFFSREECVQFRSIRIGISYRSLFVCSITSRLFDTFLLECLGDVVGGKFKALEFGGKLNSFGKFALDIVDREVGHVECGKSCVNKWGVKLDSGAFVRSS